MNDLRLKTIHNQNGSASTLSRFDYTYTPGGKIATWRRQQGSAPATLYQLGYDLADELKSATLVEAANPANVLKEKWGQAT